MSAGLDPGRRPIGFEYRDRSRWRSGVRGGAISDRGALGTVYFDIDFEERGVARLPDLDAEHVVPNLDITADDAEKVFLQCRQKVGRVPARPLVSEHDLQPVLGDDRAGPPLRKEQIQQAHQALPNSVRKMFLRSG